MKKLVAYVRFGKGLKLTDQHDDVAIFCREKGYESAGEHRELMAAIKQAHSLPALLLIPRLYPLSRDPHVIAALLEGGVQFQAIDLPDANRRWLRAHKPVAEQEAKAHSELVKVALKIVRIDPDIKLGNPKTRKNGFPDAALQKSAQKRRTLSDRTIAAVAGKIVTLRARRLNFGEIANLLNNDGHRTATDKPWKARSVERAAKRIGGATAVRIKRRRLRDIRAVARSGGTVS
jgi:hypothetical protein